MLAKAVYEVPRDEGLRFEPKWDGFRCIVFRDGDEVELGSRNDRPLTRYFPEMLPALKEACPSAAWSTASWWWDGRGARLRRPPAADPPGHVPDPAPAQETRPRSWRSTSSPWATAT
jgi:hypothetical protein